MGVLAEKVQAVTGETVELAFVDQGYTGDDAQQQAADNQMWLEMVKLPAAKKGFVLLARWWIVERNFGWMARFRQLAHDYERLPDPLKGLHFLAFTPLMAQRVIESIVAVI